MIQYLSLAYQAYHCFVMLLCSPVSVSLCLHLLVFSDLLFFSTRATQPSFTVSLSCCTHPCAFCASSFYALCAMSIQCSIPLLCILVVAHSSFYTLKSLSTTTTPSLLCTAYLWSLYILCMLSCHASTSSLMSSTLPVHH